MTFSILTLNLHSYQEIKSPEDTMAERVEKHSPIFDRIATALSDLDVDIICLQEVAEIGTEPITTPYGQAPSNAAQQINDRIDNGKRYQIRQAWSHYAWDIWREGIAIMSKQPIRDWETRYITVDHSRNWWKSRNILMTEIEHPTAGLIHVFSVHLGWWDDKQEPAQHQVEQLRQWAEQRDTNDVAATFLCGDFNNPAASPGYDFWVANDYAD